MLARTGSYVARPVPFRTAAGTMSVTVGRLAGAGEQSDRAARAIVDRHSAT